MRPGHAMHRALENNSGQASRELLGRRKRAGSLPIIRGPIAPAQDHHAGLIDPHQTPATPALLNSINADKPHQSTSSRFPPKHSRDRFRKTVMQGTKSKQ
jgi:hypothetical protein